jgi:hypothetical protein
MMRRRACGGYLTVYMTLTLAVLLSLCMTMIEGARRSAMRMQAEVITDTAMRSVLAEYNRELMRQYNIFAIDSSYGTAESGMGQTSLHFRDYMEKNYDPDVPMPWLDYRDFVGAYPESASVDSVSYLTDDHGAVFRACAVDAIKDDLGLTMAQEVIGWATSTEITAADAMDVQGDLNSQSSAVSLAAATERTGRESERESREKEYEEACKAAEEAGEEAPPEPELPSLPEQYSSPVSGIAGSVNSGILGFVTDDPEKLSRRQLDLSVIISGRMNAGDISTGTLEYASSDEGIVDEALDKALFGEYLMRYMGMYGDTDDSDALLYQIEYLISGKSNDTENLNGVAVRLLAVRAGMDLIYLESDASRKADAELLAEGICTVCMIEEMSPLLTQAILLAWALAEGRYDTKVLLSGGKIPFMKDNTTWHSEMLSALSGYDPGPFTGTETGLSYKDYLRIFMFLTDTEKLTARAMDIIESDIRLSGGNENFRMDACMEMIECSAVINSPFGNTVNIKRRLKY